MTKSVFRFVVFLTVATVLLAACHRESKTSGSAATETIAPAAGQPETAGTDAMTQTVDIEDSRSEADGGALTSPNAKVPPASTSTTATTAATTTTAPPTTTTR